MFEDEIREGIDASKVKATIKKDIVRFRTPNAGIEILLDDIISVTHAEDSMDVEMFGMNLIIYQNYMVMKRG